MKNGDSIAMPMTGADDRAYPMTFAPNTLISVARSIFNPPHELSSASRSNPAGISIMYVTPPMIRRTKRAHLYSRLQPAGAIPESYRHGTDADRSSEREQLILQNGKQMIKNGTGTVLAPVPSLLSCCPESYCRQFELC